jgi:hypothetical protein
VFQETKFFINAKGAFNMDLNLFLLSANVPKKAYLVAQPAHVGRFIWSAYWRTWDEILDCSVNGLGLSCWTVREVGSETVRHHLTLVSEGSLFDAPRIVNGRHRPPALA